MGNPSVLLFLSCSWRWRLSLLMLLQFQNGMLVLLRLTLAQQSYVDNKQLDCQHNYSTSLGYVCNNNGDASSCASYLTFRSNHPTYNSAATIGYLLGADPSEIARLNNISDVSTIPADTLIIVPVNCSCSSVQFYQHDASYVLKTTSETYFSVANNTFQGLTTCQSLMSQNPFNYRDLLVGMKLRIPLRCACPTSNQTTHGVRYLLTYLVTWRDTVESIGNTFGSGVDNQSIYDANQLSPESLIFPFTPILVPLKSQPTKAHSPISMPPPPSPPEFPAVPVGDNSSSRKWVFVGVGVAVSLLLLLSLVGFLVWFFRRRQVRPSTQGKPTPQKHAAADYTAVPELENSSWSVSGVRYAIGSLTVYKFEELQVATGFFGEANRIKGSVYRGSFKGDDAAVKMMKGNVSGEINILKQINHSNIIRLSGFCVHQGNTYLVYEYAEKGSLGDWLHLNRKKGYHYQSSSLSTTLGWKQRVQIAYDVADALNYLHNYSNPPYVHKNLKSSNVLLDGSWRAKIANFGLARTLSSPLDTNSTSNNQEDEEGGGMQLTRHVVGTHGYMAPEYIENGLITPKLDVFAFGVVMLELLSGREATRGGGGGGELLVASAARKEEDELLSATIIQVLGGERSVREKLRAFMDPCLRHEYPLDLAYSIAQLAGNCVAHDLNSRPAMAEVFMILSKILSSSLDWDPSGEFENSR